MIKYPEHDWGPTDYDWLACRICKRCKIINNYDHGPNHFIDFYVNKDKETFDYDPGCIVND